MTGVIVVDTICVYLLTGQAGYIGEDYSYG